jgi:hypothetical protein
VYTQWRGTGAYHIVIGALGAFVANIVDGVTTDIASGMVDDSWFAAILRCGGRGHIYVGLIMGRHFGKVMIHVMLCFGISLLHALVALEVRGKRAPAAEIILEAYKVIVGTIGTL